MPFALVIIALILLIVLHELGHFLAARAVGVRATKFYVFFPPAIFKRKIGDVEYGIGAIPAGGFVKLPGMFEPVPAEIAERLKWEYEQLLPLVDSDVRLRLDAARRTVLHARDADSIIEPLEEVRTGIADTLLNADDNTSEKDRAVLERAERRVEGMLDDAHPKAYWRADLWRRMVVIFAGPLVNLVIAFVVLSVFWWGLSPHFVVDAPMRLEKVEAASPAARAGLNEDARITGWNGPVEGEGLFELRSRIANGTGKAVDVTWTDGAKGAERSATITPEKLKGEDTPRLGVLLPDDQSKRALKVRRDGREVTSLGTGTKVALREMREITWGNLTRLPRVFFDSEIRQDVGSVVGIVQIADDVDRAGQFIRYVALISLILAIMNLLPLLPLDGGHLLFGVLEALRRKPMPRQAFERYSLLGIALVLMLFFIGLDNDITRARG
ncbi:MAG: site-2 protease family protein [Gaiellales bacterium]